MSFAVVPACGNSTRMGRPKLALPLGDRTVIERIVATLREGGVEQIVVVVGPHVPELVPLARSAGACVLALAEATPDMRTTVENGLLWLEEYHHPEMNDRWLLAPADHPGFCSAVVRQLLDANSTHSIVVPVHNGRRGHPTSLSWSHTHGIRALDRGEGINSYLRLHSNETRELAVADTGIFANLDTPEDYARLRERHL
jgi:molybdenum cofactor cytidylyltransferase